MAAKREVWEETGIAVGEIKQIGDYTIDFEGQKIKVYCFGTIAQDKNVRVDGQEISEAGWFEINSFPTPLSETVGQVLAFWSI